MKNMKWMALGVLMAGSTALQAQTILTLPTSGTSGSVNFYFRTDGTLMEQGSGTSSLSNSDLESSSRFIWYPAQSALRAGYGSSSETVSQIGQYSVALGYESIASGEYSTALGYYSQATGSYSFAAGFGEATFSGAVAIGGAAFATDYNAIALGSLSMSSGNGSVAIGSSVTANNSGSVAIGSNDSASGSNSTAIGAENIASGAYASALGYNATAGAYGAFVVGQYNLNQPEAGTGTVSSTTWVGTVGSADPLFEVGNGTSTLKSDALVVYKDGSAKFAGPVTVPQSGDIPMYTGN